MEAAHTATQTSIGSVHSNVFGSDRALWSSACDEKDAMEFRSDSASVEEAPTGVNAISKGHTSAQSRVHQRLMHWQSLNYQSVFCVICQIVSCGCNGNWPLKQHRIFRFDLTIPPPVQASICITLAESVPKPSSVHLDDLNTL